MLNTQNAQLWCGTCLENRKVPTQSEVHEAYYIWWSPSPSSTHTICSYRNTTQKESSSMVKLINLSWCRSKWCMHRWWPRGPTDGSVTRECPRITTACMHVAQRGVVWCLNSQFHNFDVARASETEKSRHWVRCTCSRTRTYSIYASPLPPLRRVLYTTITQTKKILPCWSN